MKRRLVSVAVIIFLGGMLVTAAQAQMGPGMMGRGGGYGPGYGPGTGWEDYDGWYCPYCGRHMGPYGWHGKGPGMMGRGMGPGMMGPGYGYGPRYRYLPKPLEEKDAQEMLQNYLQSWRNPNLKLGKIMDKGAYFEGEILTKNDSLVDKIMIDKDTGWMRSVY